jgi:MFS transporter, DHA1 family, multidrug resistance protein
MFNLTVPWRRMLLIMFVAQLMTAIGFSNIFPFLPLYVDHLGSNTSLSVEFLAGAVFSAQALTMMVASPLWGAVADRYGRKLMVQRAMFGGSIILLMMGFVRSAEELVLLRAVQGLVTGTVAAANALVASAVPRHQMGYAMGMLQMGLLSGIALGPLIGGVMADTVGYQMTFVLTAVLLFASGLLVYFGITENFTPRTNDDKQGHTLFSDWQHVLTAPGVPTTYVLSFLSHLARVIIIPIAPLFIVTLMPADGRVNTMTGLIVGLAAGASTMTAVYLGRLGDRLGHRRILRYSALAAALFYLPQAFVTGIWQLVLLQVLTGAAAGGMTPALGALLAGYTEPGEEGNVYGIDNSIVAASRAVAPLLGAAAATWFGLRSTFLLTGLVFLLVALVAIWYLPEKRPLAVEPDSPYSSSV